MAETALSSTFFICVKSIRGKSTFVPVSLDDTVLDLKMKLFALESNFRPSQARLIHDGQELSNELTLRHYNITSNSIVHHVERLRGGGSAPLKGKEDVSAIGNQEPEIQPQGLSGIASRIKMESGLGDAISIIEMKSYLAGITSTSAEEIQKWPHSDVPAEERSCHCVRQFSCHSRTERANLRGEEEWQHVPAQRHRQPPSQPTSVPQVPLSNRFEALKPEEEELQEEKLEIDPYVLKEQNIYKACLPGRGTFQCSETGLAFEVESAATIVYRYDSWSTHLKEADQNVWVPAGPLFNIWALPGTVQAVYLPHFICLSDVDISGCSIAHFEFQKMTMQQPTEVMAFSAVLENPSFSLLGVVWRKLRSVISLPMHSLVLIFQQLCAANTTLHLYLIPDDMSLKQAIEKQETSWNSKLIPKPPPFSPLFFGNRYTVSCNSKVKIRPEPHLPFCYKSPEEQQLFVEIYIRKMAEEIEFIITDGQNDTVVWRASLRSGDISLSRNVSKIPSGAAFLKKHKTELCSRMRLNTSILLHLRDECVINSEEEEEVQAQNTNQKKNRCLLDLVEKKGPKAQEKLCQVLQTVDSFLVEYLENISAWERVFPPIAGLRE